MRRAGRVSRAGKTRNVFTIFSVNLKERDQFGVRGVDGRIILRFRREGVSVDWIQVP
jgi:hypothetical protein